MNPKAILTAGAWLMSVAIVAGLVYASFDLDPSWFKQDKLIWQDWDLLRKLLAVVCVITGLVVATYPGVLLGRHKGRPFWVGPGIMTLFMLSSIVTGASAHFVSALIYPPGSVPGIWHNLPTFVGASCSPAGRMLGYIWIKRTAPPLLKRPVPSSGSTDSMRQLQGASSSGNTGTAGVFMIPSTLFQGIGALLVWWVDVVMRCWWSTR